VELFSNLAWATIIVAMLSAWLACQRRQSRFSLLPAIGVQLIALAMLSAILLPVVSVTDDLHAGDIPAEVERTCGWNHRDLASVQATHCLPVALAVLASLLRLTTTRTVEIRAAYTPIWRQQLLYRRMPWSRPPPSA
jgi:hypothetical protein